MVITRSARVARRTYRFPAPASLDSALIRVRGDDITVDFDGATLLGQEPAADPDRAAGVAILIEGGRNVRLLRARARGYKIGILARGTRNLELAENDVSHNWKPRLYSRVEHESLLDWLSFHHNDRGEWLRFGAGIYLDGVRGGLVRGNRGEQGMNGLLLARSDSLRIEGNVFSFNSGLGIGLYRSSDNTIVRNRLDYNVRGYSHGFYRRGQDSAGLLLYEQSSRNLVAYNSATHGGDGLFLWAGQSTMDSGRGGANDNLFFGNDFSFAPANGMEATFSRNSFVANRSHGSDYGMWGGYSYESRVLGNCFANNRVGIAIEHGQDNFIALNRFYRDSTAVSLWANPVEPSDWGYPKHRDTRSRDTRIEANLMLGNRVGVRGRSTINLSVERNRMAGVDSALVLRDTTGFRAGDNDEAGHGGDWEQDQCPPVLPQELAGLAADAGAPAVAPTSELARRDRSAIVVDEWGPFDWRSPKLWPVDSTRAVPLRLRVLGPPGRWRLVGRRGLAAVSASSGRVGDTISVTPAPGPGADWELTLEYRGGAVTSPRGEARPASRPYRFGYGRFEPAADWEVRFFVWGDSTDPFRRPDAFAALLGSEPALARREPRLDYLWYRPAIAGLPRERFALEASTVVELPPGEYTLRAISDDAVRIWVDGALVIDHWTPHGSALDAASLAGGRRALRVQFVQVGGWTELMVDIVRGAQRSPGSPGPH